MVVPAAGLGTRLAFDGPKALAPLLDGTLLSRVLAACEDSTDSLVLVIRPGDEALFRAELKRLGWAVPTTIITQATPTGSADAVAIGVDAVRAESGCVVVWADQVGTTGARLRMVARELQDHPRALVLPLIELASPYVWLELSAEGRLHRVGRQRDGDEVPAVGYGDLGLFAFPPSEGRRAIAEEFPPGSASGRERDFVYVLPRLARLCELRVMKVDEADEALAVNTPQDLERARRVLGRQA